MEIRDEFLSLNVIKKKLLEECERQSQKDESDETKTRGFEITKGSEEKKKKQN